MVRQLPGLGVSVSSASWRWLLPRAGLASALALGWWLVSTMWIPIVIESGYAGQSGAAVNALFAGRTEHALDEYLGYWRNVTWLGVMWCVAGWFVGPLWRWMSRPRFFERVIGAATPGTLGAIRAWTCGILLVMTLWEDLASSASLPRELMRPTGVMKLLHLLPIGFDRLLESATALWYLEHLTALLLFLGVVGLGTRVVVPASAFCYLVVAGILRGYAWFYHTGLIPIYVLAVLALTPCGEGWSVDRLWRMARGRAVSPARPAAIFGWSRYAVWVVIAIPYVAAGCSKLYYSGVAWVAADNMRAILLRTTLAMMEFDFRVSVALVEAPDLFFVMLGVVGLGTELAFGVVLASHRARLVLPALMLLVHVGILFLQNILFIDLILLLGVFYDWRSVRQEVGRRVTARYGTVQVIYDGHCGLCGRTIQLLRAFDLFDRLTFVDFRVLDNGAVQRLTGPPIDLDRLERDMAVVTGTRLQWGFKGYRRLASVLPVGWLIAPLLYLPGVTVAGETVYAWISERRTGVCDLPGPSPPNAPIDRLHRAGALAVLAIAMFLGSWWVTHIEFYPLTTMKMFSLPDPRPGTVGYVWALAHYADGTTARAPFERWIGAMADSRYRRVLSAAFGTPAERQHARQFLEASVRAAARASTNPPLASLELQLREWNFVADPHHPRQGALVDRYVLRLPE